MLNSSATAAIVLATATLAAAGALAAGRRAVHATTLAAVWWWNVACLAAIALVEVAALAAGGDRAWVTPARFAAAMTTFAPPMALLGAKRPQDRAWQWIVLSLVLVLSMPSGEWLLFGEVDEIHPARFWFLAALIGVGALNGLATRRWMSGVLFGVAQLLLLAPHTLDTRGVISPSLVGPIALWLAAVSWWMESRQPRSAVSLPLDRMWLDFRDAYGAVWALRVIQRMNDSAARYHWPVTLSWQGFVAVDDRTQATELPPAVEESLRTLLRRFVSPEWIDARLAETIDK